MAQDFSGSIADIVDRDYRTAEVFKKHHINFCCGGQLSLMDSCEKRDMDYQKLVDELLEATRSISVPNNLSFEDWDLYFLIDFILHIHHRYIFQTIPVLQQELSAFAVNHAKKLPELNPLSETFRALSSLLLIHNKHEEEITFPYIRQITDAYRRKEVYGNLFVRTLRKPLNNIQSEHLEMEKLANELKDLTNEFSFPAKACTTHKMLYRKLNEFHENLMQHRFLETKLLFPKAIAIENRLLQT